MEHEFTPQIKQVLVSTYNEISEDIYEKSPLLQYLNIKTKSATHGAKARGSFANIYAIYTLIEDYLKYGFDQRDDYSDYEGARFSDLFRRQRELPFGNKLQNHALNSRMNEEFKKYFPQVEYIPILRDLQVNRYWINENLLKVRVGDRDYNIAPAIIQVIDLYVKTKQGAFEKFIETCERLKTVTEENDAKVEEFILSLLAPNVDARLFEIVSYAILKFYYHDQTVYFGYDLENIQEENLKLYKTGRTNANDGGIDFVMRPLGRFFQVTETLDVRKYFLDIDKIERYPISFVIKSEESVDNLKQKLRKGAERQYSIKAIVEKYMNCIEEIINLIILQQRFREATVQGYLKGILDEIIRQSKIEFNYYDYEEVAE
ncbi:MAG: restriction endonuclease [Anaerolineae bacterium]|nr:restriction endonuclease [Anaerolineales bacterium]MCQ3980122.1 restriction endonuclease [Anaerolineae bacterium]